MDFAENKALLHKELTTILNGKFEPRNAPAEKLFLHEAHTSFVLGYLTQFRVSASFDIQKPWLVYWGLNALAVLGELDRLSVSDRRTLGQFILSFQDLKGGFAGGQGYQPNMVSLYASILSLVILDLEELNQQVNVKGVEEFMWGCRGPLPGSFYIHENGEIDIRCSYIAILVSKLLGINRLELLEGIPAYVRSCQTFEGGIAPYPNMEAHGGYTFCGVAAMALLGRLEDLELKKLVFWLSNCQTEYGGFCGRTNKLVDSCYSFWQSASLHILHEALEGKSEGTCIDGLLYDEQRLQVYILECCQEEQGGLRDKPGKDEDIYHTMYGLAGLAMASQDFQEAQTNVYNWKNYFLEEMDPIHNVPRFKVNKFLMYFREQFAQTGPVPKEP
jgi:protein farnesyltransferase subunit beta